MHNAAVLEKKGAGLKIVSRPTVTNPGPRELLIKVKAIAFNPIDYMQLKNGFPPIQYPAILGSDVAGTISAVYQDNYQQQHQQQDQKDEKNQHQSHHTFKVGDRVAAFAPCFWAKGSPNYGAFQEYVLVPESNTIALPTNLPFTEASTLPMAVETAWTAFHALDLPLDDSPIPETPNRKKRAILIWGVGGSVGSAALQIARLKGFLVYATASAKHHAYLKQLGTNGGNSHRRGIVHFFDYNDANVIQLLAAKAKEDGVTAVDLAILAAGDLSTCIKAITALKGGDKSVLVKVASAPWSFGLLWWRLFPRWSNVQVKFVETPTDAKARDAHFAFVSHWVTKQLAANEFTPSPKVEVVPGGLQGIQPALERLQKGVSGVKLVVELA